MTNAFARRQPWAIIADYRCNEDANFWWERRAWNSQDPRLTQCPSLIFDIWSMLSLTYCTMKEVKFSAPSVSAIK